MDIKKVLLKDLKKIILKNNISINYINHINLTTKSKIGHYQINGIITISKILQIKTLEISKKIIFGLQNNKRYKKIKYSEPGFINIFLNTFWISKITETIIHCKRLGISKKNPQNVIIDYSSPNMAKEMHVGHLRSTVIGDSMARIIEFCGNNITRVNHIGDWGIQFGMLIALIKKKKIKFSKVNITLQEIEKFYQESKKLYDTDDSFKKQSDKYFIDLQNYHTTYTKIWKKIVNITIQENNVIYKLLNIKLNNNNIIGESFYVNMLPKILLDLKKKKITSQYKGDTLVYLDEIQNKDGKPMGVILQKQDHRFLYSTIDLACLKYRINVLKANRIIYYTDIRQKQHLTQVSIIAKKAQYIPQEFDLEHHTFGMILSKNNKPFKTRDGKLIKLHSLIKEAIKKAEIIIKEKNKNFRKKKIIYLSRIIGISAIKYFDLSKNRKKNYIFNWEKILSFNSNTALYIQYTYTRIYSIFKKSKIKICHIKSPIILNKKIEINLCIKLLEFEEVIKKIEKQGTPHILCLYLFQVCSLFSVFYEKYPILYAKKIKIKNSRLKLSFLTSRIIKKGLQLLGIQTVKHM
ncbi:arginine--tRNA ligase [Buchnera aphidicola]|uniref:arginine--tRNA ligase n=1 Tax=Buchnera aphidicola TaxID=9 RepID=UPI003463AE20